MRELPYELIPFSHANLCAGFANSHVSAEILSGQDKLKYLSDYLTAISSKTIVIENNYVDGDYLDDFSNYYVKCFKTYERKCKRLHFLSVDITDVDFKNIIVRPEDESFQRVRNAYLGFSVARPLPDAVIGRTALKTYPSDGGRRNYTCTKPYNVGLFGIDLTVDSLVFQEQDNVLAACATVALWCSFHKTAQLFGTAIPTPSRITTCANDVVNYVRPIPSHGLNIQQICNAIRSVGLDPEVIVVNSGVSVPSLAYGHLSHGLPVILIANVEGIGMHAITLTGYSINATPVMTCEVDPKSQCIPMAGLRINEFYAHDDQIGPFCRVVVKPCATVNTKTYPVVFESSWKDQKTGKSLTLYPEMVVIPVYHKIRVTFVDVQKWLTRLHALVGLLLKGAGRLEWDLRLTTTNEYKRLLHHSALDDEKRQQLLFAAFPKYMWRATLKADDIDLLDCLVDATDMMQSAPFQMMIWHSEALRTEVHKALTDPSLKDVLRLTLTARFAEILTEKSN